MKHLFNDDSQPEARDFDDNYSMSAPRPKFAVARQWRTVKPDARNAPLLLFNRRQPMQVPVRQN